MKSIAMYAKGEPRVGDPGTVFDSTGHGDMRFSPSWHTGAEKYRITEVLSPHPFARPAVGGTWSDKVYYHVEVEYAGIYTGAADFA